MVLVVAFLQNNGAPCAPCARWGSGGCRTTGVPGAQELRRDTAVAVDLDEEVDY